MLEEEKRRLQQTIAEVRQQKEHLEFLLEAHKPHCGTGAKQIVTTVVATSLAAPTTVPKQPDVSVIPPKLSTENSRQVNITNAIHASMPSVSLRPNTLMLPKRGTGDDAAAGSASSDFFPTMGLDLMLEGHTGLTPLTTSATPVGAAGLLSCTNQQHQRAANASGNSAENTSALMAL